jgi:nitric oxide reductase NorD protein
VAATTTRKLGQRLDRDEANRKDSFILHRFESILSWVESMNLNRSVDDDDDENAQKAADDQDNITLSKVDKRAATRLRLHLDLSPSDADHEKLAGTFTYPEWNHRSRSYMDAHCRVLDAPAVPDPSETFPPNAARTREVRRQFETLRPRRILRPRQIDGTELDLDALITAQTDLIATGHGSDRIWQSSRQIERDLAVAFLVDTSRSTEAAVGDTSVIDVAREALASLATGIDAAGDQLGIWGFSSLRRDRVFLTRCKGFETKMGPEVTANICALRPGHYTRLGAAIRHTSAMLAEQTAARKLLIVLTDGKPNDLDHYEGQHGIEDSRMAVREARRAGQSLHGVIIDEDGQDWFARIFGRGGFSLLPHPARLTRALPDIYRSLTQET